MPYPYNSWTRLFPLFGFAAILIFQVYFVGRSSFLAYLLCYSVFFFLFFLIVAQNSLRSLFQFSLFLYPLTFVALPELSNDFYRFLWDGELLHLGINPYDFQPSELIHQTTFSSHYFQELYNGMGYLSQHAYSPYPVVNQSFFYLTTFSNQLIVNVVFLRVLILLGVYLLYFIIKKLMLNQQQNPKWATLFLLNPFVLIEFAVNLHFEVWMLVFLLYSFYLLQQGKIIAASFFGAVSIQLKLIPLLFYPTLWRTQSSKKSLVFYLFSFVFTGLISLTLFDATNSLHFLQTISWYFNKFEFNGGIYFLARGFAYLFSEYNQIAIVGKVLSIICLVSILFISLRKHYCLLSASFYYVCFCIAIIYFSFATTVHPWYVLTPFVFSLLAGNFVGLLWTFSIALSYYFYSHGYTAITYFLVGLEWGSLLLFWLITSKKTTWEDALKQTLGLQ